MIVCKNVCERVRVHHQEVLKRSRDGTYVSGPSHYQIIESDEAFKIYLDVSLDTLCQGQYGGYGLNIPKVQGVAIHAPIKHFDLYRQDSGTGFR